MVIDECYVYLCKIENELRPNVKCFRLDNMYVYPIHQPGYKLRSFLIFCFNNEEVITYGKHQHSHLHKNNVLIAMYTSTFCMPCS